MEGGRRFLNEKRPGGDREEGVLRETEAEFCGCPF